MTTPATTGNDRLTIRGTILTPQGLIPSGWIALDGGRVDEIGSTRSPAGGETVDLGERIVAPGYIDLHVHGGAGAQVNGTSVSGVTDAVLHIARFHATHGTTALLATAVSDSQHALLTTVAGIAGAGKRIGTGGATVLGAHLEGPWLAPSRAGAQNRAYLRDPNVYELRGLLDAAVGSLRLITIAPERSGALAVIAEGVSAGIVMSVGHTEADFDATRAAFDAGARHVTHLFNAMPSLHHRHPGPVVAALADPRITLELIADGIHIHPAVLALVTSVAPRRVVAVTDAMCAAGLEPGRYRLGELDVELVGRRVTLARAPETLAGSVLTMDLAVATLVKAGIPVVEAIRAATATPASVIGATSKGNLISGADSDIVVLEPDLRLAATIIGGRIVYDPRKLFAKRALVAASDRS